MKIAVLSDTHGSKLHMDSIIPQLKECDLIIHAGDNFYDSKYIHSKTNIGIMAVKGNCDFDNVESDLIFEIENKTIFLTHGDRYRVKQDLNTISKKAKEVNANIVIFGHTHIPLHEEHENITYINPGSLSLPRVVKEGSFVIMNISENNVQLEFMNLPERL